ncbi:MAG TPA: ankyrin repeat domain-containing protein [Pyrinomonadaceae bacterium]|nr:ankyrin repeat domain-containing protein [Pyrinomonadaceae bacterium]
MNPLIIEARNLVSLLIIISALALNSCYQSTVTGDSSRSDKRCQARWYDGPSEDPRCFELQRRLAAAAWAGDVPEIKRSIDEGANVNGGAYQSLSALTSASDQGKDDAVKLLLELGADVNRVEGVGNTALKSAVSFGHLSTARILLDAGADVCEKTESSALQRRVSTYSLKLTPSTMSIRVWSFAPKMRTISVRITRTILTP